MVKTETKVNKAQKADFATFDNMTKSAIKKAQEVYPSHDPELNKTNEETFGFASGFSQKNSFRELYNKNKGEYDRHFKHLKVEDNNTEIPIKQEERRTQNIQPNITIQQNQTEVQNPIKENITQEKEEPSLNQMMQKTNEQNSASTEISNNQSTENNSNDNNKEKPKIDINSIFDVNREK
jgi:hypothetical protein